jgi:2-hydroxychromene-2-carboxylate isomerase
LPPTAAQPVFYYDLGSPVCYLAAERIGTALGEPAEWEPVLAWVPEPEPDRERIERDAAELGLQAWRWPTTWPPDTRSAMLAATYAKQIGRAVAFSLAAFRQAFAGGRELGDVDTVLIAAAACEMHPTAVLKAIELRSVTDALARATARARAAGAQRLPAVEADGRTFDGPDALRDAAGARA